jgi:flavodoxin
MKYGGDMKTAVVFYSLDGNCAFIAEELKARLNADLIRLQTIDEKQRKGFTKFFWGCKLMLSRKNPPLKPYTFNPAAYDLIIIGAPVWAGAPASPVRTFISKAGITGKKIATYVCHDGGIGKAFQKLRVLLNGNEIIAETEFLKTIKNSEKVKQQIADWVKLLTG